MKFTPALGTNSPEKEIFTCRSHVKIFEKPPLVPGWPDLHAVSRIEEKEERWLKPKSKVPACEPEEWNEGECQDETIEMQYEDPWDEAL